MNRKCAWDPYPNATRKPRRWISSQILFIFLSINTIWPNRTSIQSALSAIGPIGHRAAPLVAKECASGIESRWWWIASPEWQWPLYPPTAILTLWRKLLAWPIVLIAVSAWPRLKVCKFNFWVVMSWSWFSFMSRYLHGGAGGGTLPWCIPSMVVRRPKRNVRTVQLRRMSC